VKACALLGQRLPNFRCLIIGEGEDRKKIEHLIAKLNLRHIVQLLGARPQDEVTAQLAEADLFVLPSVVAPNGQMEGIPVALMEAMASGLPVVATRLSGIPELVQDGVTGLLVTPGDERALADAIALLHQREHLRQEMGRRGQKKVTREFELTQSVTKLRSLFHQEMDDGPQTMDDGFYHSSSIVHRPSSSVDFVDEIGERIREKVASYFPDLASYGGSIDVRVSRRGGGHDSEVYEIAMVNGHRDPRQLILKLHRPARAKPEEMAMQARKYAQREYAALSFLWQEFSRRSTRLAVPRPLDYLPEYAALVVEKCQGETLDQALRWARLRRTSSQREWLCQQVKACGEWLALFHSVTGRRGNPSEIYQRIEGDFYDDLKTCTEVGLNPELASHVAMWFERKKRVAFSGDHKLVGYHCDFGPYNVFLSQNRITVIDLEGLQAGIIYDDLCYFLGMIEAMPVYHLSHELSQRIKASFLEGYWQDENFNREQFDVFMLITMVKIMAHSPMLKAEAGWFNWWKRQQRLGFYTNWFKERVE
jgi:Ser/Thr protein kinase RdoA (MazF antagonist)